MITNVDEYLAGIEAALEDDIGEGCINKLRADVLAYQVGLLRKQLKRAAEELGVAALQSGEAPSQQPQLEMPSLAQFMEWCVIQGFDSVQATASYYYIARHIKQVR